MLIIFLKSIVIGIAITLPIGPIGLLCIRKAAQLGIYAGIAVGFGAGLAESLCGLIVGSSFWIISDFIMKYSTLLKIIWGFLLIYLAFTQIKFKIYDKDSTNFNIEISKLFSQAFLLTLVNPMTILSFITIFSFVSAAPLSNEELIAVISGLFIGSFIWWLILSYLTNKIKSQVPYKFIKYIRNFSTLMLTILGILAFYSALE